MKTRTLTILQADLVGSTTTAASISRQEMTDYLEEATAQISHAIRYYGGDPFKFTGDGYLASFESASDCLHAAQKIQRDMQTRNLIIAGRPVGALRIIVHTADVVVTEDDLLGDGVATVSRLEKMTPPSAIYVTETTRGVCKRAEFEFEYVDTYALRGLPDPIRVYELKYRDRLHIEQGVFILVSDIKKFSRLTETVSPQVLEQYLATLHRLHREAARMFSGALAKIMGDKVLMTFQSADDALSAALALTEGAATYCRQQPDMPEIQLTIGITYGDVYRFSSDMYGAAVNEAFLLASRLDDYAIAFVESVRERLTVDPAPFACVTGPLTEWPDCALTIYACLRGALQAPQIGETPPA
jgi:class 3 adenylate cyclase